MPDDDRRWKCQVCGQSYVITTFARDCERSHKEETNGKD